MPPFSLQEVFAAAYELAFSPIPVNAAMIGAGIVLLILFRYAKLRWLNDPELDALVPKYGRKIARQIVKARRHQPEQQAIPFYHNEPWD